MNTEEEFQLKGTTVRIARTIKGLSVLELAELTGIGSSMLYQIEQNVKGISHRNYYRLLRALRRDLHYTDNQLVAIEILVNNIEEMEEKQK